MDGAAILVRGKDLISHNSLTYGILGIIEDMPLLYFAVNSAKMIVQRVGLILDQRPIKQ